jgi:serine/threonine protein kinase
MTYNIAQLQQLTDEQIGFYMYQLIYCLKYLHDAGIVHRDLTPRNLLTDWNCTLCLADFGLSRGIASHGDEAMTDYVVSRHYRSPELIMEVACYTQAVDIWAAGCVYAFMVGDCVPLFAGRNSLDQLELIFRMLGAPTDEELESIPQEQTRKYIRTRMRYTAPSSTPDYLRQRLPKIPSDIAADFLARMLTVNQTKRATAAELLQHPYLSGWADSAEDDNPPPPFYSWPLEATELDGRQLRELLWAEIGGFNPSYQTIPPPQTYPRSTTRSDAKNEEEEEDMETLNVLKSDSAPLDDACDGPSPMDK